MTQVDFSKILPIGKNQVDEVGTLQKGDIRSAMRTVGEIGWCEMSTS